MCDFSERADRLRTVVTGIDPDSPIAILIAQVDPDAIASACGLRMQIRYLSENRRGSEIYYAGHVSHPQNNQIIYKFGLQPSNLKPISKLDRDHQSFVLVDSSSMVDSRLQTLGKINPLITIDHHRSESAPQENERNFVLIEDVGAASTLVAKLIETLNIPIPRDYKWIPTLLALGIYTDTHGLVSAGHKDREAYSWARNLANEHDLAELIRFRLPPSYYEISRAALTNMISRNGRLVTGVGTIRPEDGDFLAMVADDLIRMQSISVAVVWGIVGNRVRLSARSADLTVPLDRFLSERFGSRAGAKLTPDGHGEGGGSLELDLGIWHSSTTAEHVRDMVNARMQELIFEN